MKGRERIGRLTPLGDGKDQGLVAEWRIAVAEFAGIFHLDRDARQFLDHVFPHQGRVPARAAGGEDNAVDLPQLLGAQVQAPEDGGRIVVAQATPHRIAKRLRLFVNLLEHVVCIARQADTVAILLQGLHCMFDVTLIAVHDLQRVAGNHRQFVVGEVNNLVRVADHRGGVAGNKMFAIADADHHRAAEPGANQHIRVVPKQDHDAVGTAELREGLLDGCNQGRIGPGGTVGWHPVRLGLAGMFQVVGNQVADNLAVGRGLKGIAFADQACFDLLIIFNHPVVNDRQHLGTTHVGMRVFVARLPVGCPAGMSDADFAADGILSETGDQILDPAFGLGNRELSPAINGRHATAVVTAIFESPQSFDQKLRCFPMPHVSHNTAHT